MDIEISGFTNCILHRGQSISIWLWPLIAFRETGDFWGEPSFLNCVSKKVFHIVIITLNAFRETGNSRGTLHNNDDNNNTLMAKMDPQVLLVLLWLLSSISWYRRKRCQRKIINYPSLRTRSSAFFVANSRCHLRQNQRWLTPMK